MHRFSSLEAGHVSFCKILIQAFQLVNLKSFKWLLVSEDSSFVLLEVRSFSGIFCHSTKPLFLWQNVRKLVAPLDPSTPYYLVSLGSRSSHDGL